MIDLLRERPGAWARVEQLIHKGQTLFATPHVLYELLRGVRRAQDPRAQTRWISHMGQRFRMLPFEREAALLAARMADALEDQGVRIPDLDLFIAASAVVWGDGIVVTHDLSHFRRLRAVGVRALPV